MAGGHEVYILDADANSHLLTSGEDGECGGANDWPYANTESGHYLYNHDDADSVVDGVSAAFGYEQQVFLVG